jgi:major membrane immunogen (membrane-anchored lipoprotein)
VKKPVIILTVLFALTIANLSACGGVSYKDGVFAGKSDEDEDGAFGEITVTVENSEITDCRFVTWQKDGSLKDEDYGKVNGEISNRDFYDKAQLAVKAMAQYAEQLKQTQKLSDVEAVSGATVSHGQFLEAAQYALAQARK